MKKIYENLYSPRFLMVFYFSMKITILYIDKNKVNFEAFSITESVNEDTYVEISFTPVVYSENIGVTVTIRNITSEKKLEDMRAEFISSVSHELKTPMVMITGYSEAL